MKPKESAPLIDHMATIGTLLLSGVRANVLITALLSKTTFHRQGTQACRLTNRYLLSKTTFQSLADIYNYLIVSQYQVLRRKTNFAMSDSLYMFNFLKHFEISYFSRCNQVTFDKLYLQLLKDRKRYIFPKHVFLSP